MKPSDAPLSVSESDSEPSLDIDIEAISSSGFPNWIYILVLIILEAIVFLFFRKN